MTARPEGQTLQMTTMMKRLVPFVGVLLLSVQAFAFQAPTAQAPPPGQAPPGQGEYVPIEQLPPGQQLPAAPLLIAAYAFVWLAVFFYVWTIWRRLNKVEAEIRIFEKRQSQRGSSR
jgi:CcmD family protein